MPFSSSTFPLIGSRPAKFAELLLVKALAVETLLTLDFFLNAI